jgi:polyisoprenoid-binding protein YceI
MQKSLFLIVLTLAARAAAADECHAVDAARGSVKFELRQAGSPFRGTFKRFGGELCLAQERVTNIAVWLEPASVDTGLPEIDAALKEQEFFDVRNHPRIAFNGAGANGVARGALEIRGKRRELDVPLRLNGSGPSRTVSGSFTLRRLDYGIGTGEWSDTRWLGDEVKVEFSAALRPK